MTLFRRASILKFNTSQIQTFNRHRNGYHDLDLQYFTKITPTRTASQRNPRGRPHVNAITLPKREGWTITDIMALGKDYTLDDAAEITTAYWNEYADRLESTLFYVVDLTENVELRGDDVTDLVEKFLKYPARPKLEAAESQEVQAKLLDEAWHQWAAHVEQLFIDLKQSIERGEPLPQEYQQVIHAGQPKPFVLSSLSQGDGSEPSHGSRILRSCLYLRDVRVQTSIAGPGNDCDGIEAAMATVRLENDELVDGMGKMDLDDEADWKSGNHWDPALAIEHHFKDGPAA